LFLKGIPLKQHMCMTSAVIWDIVKGCGPILMCLEKKDGGRNNALTQFFWHVKVLSNGATRLARKENFINIISLIHLYMVEEKS
jgi:hypothetical protein